MKYITLHYLSLEGKKGFQLLLNPDLIAIMQNQEDEVKAFRCNYTKIWFTPSFVIDVYETIEEINEKIQREMLWVIPNG